jgi:hypothetical protein
MDYSEIGQVELANHALDQGVETTNQNLDDTQLTSLNPGGIDPEMGDVSQNDEATGLETMTSQSHDHDLANESIVINMGANEELEGVDEVIEVSMEEGEETEIGNTDLESGTFSANKQG